MNSNSPEPTSPSPKQNPAPSSQPGRLKPSETEARPQDQHELFRKADEVIDRTRTRYVLIDYNGEHEDKSLIAEFADNGDLVLTASADGTPLDDDYDSTSYDWEQRIVVKAQDLSSLAGILERNAGKPLPDRLEEKLVAGLTAQIRSPFNAES